MCPQARLNEGIGRFFIVKLGARKNRIGGGDLYVGLIESEIMGVKTRTWRGFKGQEGANGHIQSLEAPFPLGAEYSYGFLRAPGSPGLVLHIEVQKTAAL